MTGRPPLPIGTHGGFTTVEIEPGVFRARTHYRDVDGETRRVERRGKSKTNAENNLRAALTERRKAAGGELTGDSRVSEAAEQQLARWREAVAAGRRAPRTVEAYEDSLRLHVLPALGALRLREATPGRCERWLVRLQETAGPGVAKRARTVLSAVLGLATRMDALPTNPVRDLSPVPGSTTTRAPRAMTAAEATQWLDWLDTHVAKPPSLRGRAPKHVWPDAPIIASRALGDISRLMLGTGIRIGEAMAVGWDEVDFDARTVAIRWHLVSVRGQGLQRMPGSKSKAGDRLLRVPSWVLEMLARRRVDNPKAVPVFPDALGGWRDPNLVMRWLRWSREEAGFDWLTSHVFRQTVITWLDTNELGTREVADQAGHSKIAQTQAYMARKVASDRAAQLLETILDVPGDEGVAS